MSTIVRRPVWSVAVTDEHDATVTLAAPELTMTLDSGAVPYGSASATFPLLSPETIDALDPRDDARGVVTLGESGNSPREFDLGIRQVAVDHVAKTVRLELATDEALLQDYKPLADDGTPYAHQTSARAVVNHVLGVVIPGAALEAGGPDADVTAVPDAVNLSPNGGFRSNVTGWVASGVPLNRVAADAFLTDRGITYFARAAFTGGQSGGIFNNGAESSGVTEVPVTAGTAYRTAIWVRSSVGVTVRLNVEWVTSAGAFVGQSAGTAVTLAAGVWTRLDETFTAPATAARAAAYVYRTSGTWPSGATLDVAGHRLGEAPEISYDPFDFFDGDTPDSTGYGYSWAAGASASAAQRVSLLNRSPELLVWRAGDSAWEFLVPIVTSVGLRLYCDESRAWRLVDPSDFATPGRLALSPLVSVAGTDTIGRDVEAGCTGVVVRFTWRDLDGQSREAIDSAGEPGRVLVVPLDRAYPGPGIAAAILSRLEGRGRVQDVTALADWDATPGQEASISLPATTPQIGRVASIEWTLPAATMRVGTVALTDLIPGTIAALTGTIDGLTGTIDSL